MEYKAVEKFNSLSDEDKILKIYHHALVGLQNSLFAFMGNPDAQIRESTQEYQAYLKAVIDYLAPLMGHDPKYLYPREPSSE